MNDFTIKIKRLIQQVDWNLLVFLLLFLNVKLVVKLIALCFMYTRRFDFSFKFSKQRLPLFYPAMIAIALINFFIFSYWRGHNYSILLLTGIAFWGMCILALHQVVLSVDQSSLRKLHNTVLIFFVLNAAVSCIDLLVIIIETGELNPYRYQGMYQKYFIGTGDYIRGITFDTSTTNAILNAFGVMYFLYRKRMLLSLLCMVVLLLTCSNFTNVLIIGSLLAMFFFRTDRSQKSIIVIQIMLLTIFMATISPQNNTYAIGIVEKTFTGTENKVKNNAKPITTVEIPDSLLTTAGRRNKIAKLYLDSIARARQLLPQAMQAAVAEDKNLIKQIPKANIHTPEYQHRPDSSEARMQALNFLHKLETNEGIATNTLASHVSQPTGKLVAFQELYRFMRAHPSKLLTGNGTGNFSSKLAFRATGLQIAGGYPAAYTYISKDFEANHLSDYLNYFGKDSGYHSIANSPNSVYAQLLGEYGLAGCICFLLCYLLFFAKGFKKLTYGLPIFFIMTGAFISEYWFEQLSIVVMFELLILLNRKDLLLINTDMA
jgi:hypothetical protein